AQRLVANLLPVHSDPPLFDHPQGVRGTWAYAGRFQHLGDGRTVRGRVEHLLLEVVWDPSMPETSLEILQRRAGGRRIVEARDDLRREAHLDVARVRALPDRTPPAGDRF